MIEEHGRVVAVGRGFAWVETARKNACGTCSASSGCGTALVAKLFGERNSRLQVCDEIGLEVGDSVVIGIADDTLIRASVLAYLLPLAALIMAAFIAESARAPDELGALVGILGLCAGLWVARRLTVGASGRERYRPMVLRRSDPDPVSVPIRMISNRQ